MEHHTQDTTLERRVAQLELALSALGEELRTRRLVVADGDGQERIVGCVRRGTAELTVARPGCPEGQGGAVVLFANPGDEHLDLEPGVGLQLWAVGDVVQEVSSWTDGPER